MPKWNKDDLYRSNSAESPWYYVDNVTGTVDIGDKHGEDHKISLYPYGMYKLVKEWLGSGHGLTKEQKQELINLLKK